MRLLPLARLIVLLGRRRVDAVMHPAMPARRDQRSFRIAIVDHPSARAAFRILAALVVDIAELIAPDFRAIPPRVKARPERLAVPPGEELGQEFHGRVPCSGTGFRLPPYGVRHVLWQGGVGLCSRLRVSLSELHLEPGMRSPEA